MHYDSNRQTGRTTRMLKQAIEAASAGNFVYVIAHNSEYAKKLAALAEEIASYKCWVSLDNSDGNRVLYILQWRSGHIKFLGFNESTICLDADPYCVRGHKEKCFVDHYVWETHFSKPSHKWSKDGYKRLWQSLFPGSPFGVVPSYTEIVQSVANTMVKKPYMSSADGDMRDKFGGGKLP